MADKLAIYNEVLSELLAKRLASLAENREERRAIDDVWDQEVAYCLERHFWNFSYRAVQLDALEAVEPAFGYLYAFAVPDDRIRTRRLSASPTFDPPLLQMSEENGYWYTNITPIYVQYNSNDTNYGMDLAKWPATFTRFLVLRLAVRACKRITSEDKLLQGPYGLIKQEEKARKVAEANCAMNEAIGFAPTGSWVKARRGFGSAPGAGGDAPTGSSLI